MRSATGFRSLIITLWFRLITLAVVASVFYEALVLVRGKAQGWAFYLPGIEVAYEVLTRLVAASVVGLRVRHRHCRGHRARSLVFQVAA